MLPGYKHLLINLFTYMTPIAVVAALCVSRYDIDMKDSISLTEFLMINMCVSLLMVAVVWVIVCVCRRAALFFYTNMLHSDIHLAVDTTSNTVECICTCGGYICFFVLSWLTVQGARRKESLQ